MSWLSFNKHNHHQQSASIVTIFNFSTTFMLTTIKLWKKHFLLMKDKIKNSYWKRLGCSPFLHFPILCNTHTNKLSSLSCGAYITTHTTVQKNSSSNTHTHTHTPYNRIWTKKRREEKTILVWKGLEGF